MAAEWKLVLGNISATDQLELIDLLGHDGVRFETVPAGGTRAGEPVTIAVIGVTAIAVTGLVAFLLKERESKRVRIKSLRIEGPGGSMELQGVELDLEKEKEPKSALVNALQKWIGTALKGGN